MPDQYTSEDSVKHLTLRAYSHRSAGLADAYNNFSGRDHDRTLEGRVHPGRFAVSPGPCAPSPT
jgi:hypothetical protein